MATFKDTAMNQLKDHTAVFLLWLSLPFRESGTNFTIFQIGILAVLAFITTLQFLAVAVIGLNTLKLLLGIASIAAATGWKRAALHEMLLLAVLGLINAAYFFFAAAYFFLAAAVFQHKYRYLTQYAGSPSLIGMELIVVMAYVPMHVWVAVS